MIHHLANAAARLSAGSGRRQTLQAAVEALVTDFGAAAAQLWLHDPLTGRLREAASAPDPPVPPSVPGAVPAWVAEAAGAGRPTVRDELRGSPDADAPGIDRPQATCLAAFPLGAGGPACGLLASFFHQPIPDDLVETLAVYATLVGLALDRVRLVATEGAARGAAERFAGVLRAATEYAIIGTDASGIVTVFNEGAERMLGYRAHEVVGRLTPLSWHDVAEVAARSAGLGVTPGFEVFVAAAREGGAETQEWTFVRRDGTRLSVALTVTPMREAGGHLTGFIGIARDVTESRQARERLEQREGQLARAEQLAHLGSWEWDIPSDSLTWSDELYRIFGMAPGAVRASYETFLEGVHAQDRDRVGVAILDASQRGAPLDFEFRIVRPDGAARVLHSLGETLVDAAGQVVRLVGTAQDITEHRAAEEERAHLTAILEATPDLVGMADLQGRSLYLNRSGRLMLDLPEDEEVAGVPIKQLHPPWAYELVATMGIPTAIREGAWRGETAILGPDRREIPVSQVILAHRSPTGEVQYLSTIIRDITALKRGEESLMRQAQELARSNADLEQFAYVASHDLQEPLRMVASYTQLLARRYRGKLGADADEFIAYAVDGATRMQQLINDLLAYSRVGTRGGDFAPTDCGALVDEVANDLRPAIEAAGASLTRDPLPTVPADGPQLRQVFQNLIGNAIKFHGADPPRVHVAAEPLEGEWRFSVRDNGIGIAPNCADRIFVIFQRLHTQAEYDGTGIGLAICKKVVERHGGRIWVESAPGRGSSFFFTIPQGGDTSR